MNNPILRNAVVTIASFVFVISVVSAWTAPTGVPPTNNVSAPINVGGDQIKSGALGVAALVSLGGVQIGTTTVSCTNGPTGTAGTVRWYKGAMEYCNGTAWVAFGGGGGGVETDPTVPANLKDGVSWSEIGGTPVTTKGGIVAGCGAGTGSGQFGEDYMKCWGGANSGEVCPGGSTIRKISQYYGSVSGTNHNTFICVKD